MPEITDTLGDMGIEKVGSFTFGIDWVALLVDCSAGGGLRICENESGLSGIVLIC